MGKCHGTPGTLYRFLQQAAPHHSEGSLLFLFAADMKIIANTCKKEYNIDKYAIQAGEEQG